MITTFFNSTSFSFYKSIKGYKTRVSTTTFERVTIVRAIEICVGNATYFDHMLKGVEIDWAIAICHAFRPQPFEPQTLPIAIKR